MRKAVLIRMNSDDQGTEGILLSDKGYRCHTIELPWRENQFSISCIPEGTYKVITRQSGKYGKIYWLQSTDPRTYILIHWGNFAGDIEKGWKTHSQGCILLGQRSGVINNGNQQQKAVLNSRTTVRNFMKHMNNESFELKIVNIKGES